MSLQENDTLSKLSMHGEALNCRVLTGAGRAAIAVLVVEGDQCLRVIKANVRMATQRPMVPGQVRYAQWIGNSAGNVPHRRDDTAAEPIADAETTSESIVLVPIANNRVEIHCHGGRAATERILEGLRDAGENLQVTELKGTGSGDNAQSSPAASVSASAKPIVAEPSASGSVAQSTGSDLSGRDRFRPDHFGFDPLLESSDPLINEAIGVLNRCTTKQTAAIALSQVRGALSRWRAAGQKSLVEEDSRAAASVIAAEAMHIHRFSRVTTRLNSYWDVVFAGPPNVGKSSLINALVGFDRSITMDLPGTTRDVLDAETVLGGWPIRLRDTAGLRDSDDQIEREGVARAGDAVSKADLVVLVRDSWDPPPEDSGRLSLLTDDQSALEVINKIDLLGATGAALDVRDAIKTIATTGEGIDALAESIIDALIGDLPPVGSPVAVTHRQASWLEEIAASEDDPLRMKRLLNAGTIDE